MLITAGVLNLTRFDGHPRSAAKPWKDVHYGDDGTNEAFASVIHQRFKPEVVALVRQPGNTAASVAPDLDLTDTAVREWVKQADVDDGARDGLTTAARAEVAALRKEVRVLREERDIVKHASAFFARETR